MRIFSLESASYFQNRMEISRVWKKRFDFVKKYTVGYATTNDATVNSFYQ